MSLNFQSLANEPDSVQINTLIENVATFADRGDFESLEELFGPEVEVDYTSAFGGTPEVKKAPDLMATWKGLLPGFDSTRHVITNIDSNIKNLDATVTADVVADHYLGTQHWQVSGNYKFQTQKIGSRWLITAMAFILKHETGSRDVLPLAVEIAQKKLQHKDRM